MGTTWLIGIGIIVALGWLYFSAKLRPLRLRVPLDVPAERDGSAPAERTTEHRVYGPPPPG